MDVADFLELQRPFQGGREIELPAQVEEVVAVGVLLGDLAARRRSHFERFADLVGQLLQLLDDPHGRPRSSGAAAGRSTGPASPARRHCDGEGLGRGDADFRAGVQVDAAVGLLGDRAADDVADGQRRVALALHFAQGGQRVGRFAALRDGEQQRAGCRAADCDSAVRWRIRLRPESGRALRSGIRRPAPRARLVPQAVRMMRFDRRSCCGVRFRPPNLAVASSSFKPAAHGVFERLGLLEDFLEHVVREAAQFDVAGLDFEHLHAVLDVALVAMDDAKGVGGDDGQFVIGQVDDLVGVADQRRGVAGDEVFAFANADHQRAAEPGGDDALRDNRGRGSPGHRCLELGERPQDGRGELLMFLSNGLRSRIDHSFFEVLVDQMGDDFGVGRRLEDVALVLEPLS